MRARILGPATATLTLTLTLVLASCTKAQPPDTVQADLAKATDSAYRDDAKAEQQLDKAAQEADGDLARAEARADQRHAAAAGDAVITKAEGDHKVALAECEALSGQDREDCRKHADYQLDAVKDRVDQLKQSSPRSIHAPPTRE